MTWATRAPATRSSLLRHTRRLDQVRRGAALLKRKRQSLVEELFARAKTAVTSREAIDAQARRAWRSVWLALSSSGSDGLTPLGWPTREVDVELRAVELWDIRAMELVNRPAMVRSLAARRDRNQGAEIRLVKMNFSADDADTRGRNRRDTNCANLLG